MKDDGRVGPCARPTDADDVAVGGDQPRVCGHHGDLDAHFHSLSEQAQGVRDHLDRRRTAEFRRDRAADAGEAVRCDEDGDLGLAKLGRVLGIKVEEIGASEPGVVADADQFRILSRKGFGETEAGDPGTRGHDHMPHIALLQAPEDAVDDIGGCVPFGRFERLGHPSSCSFPDPSPHKP